MSGIDVYIAFSDGRTIRAQLTDSQCMEQLVRRIVRIKKLPARNSDGMLLKYGLIRPGEEEPIADTLTLAEAGVQSEEVLTLVSSASYKDELKEVIRRLKLEEKTESHRTEIHLGIIFLCAEMLVGWLINVMDGNSKLTSPSMIIIILLILLTLIFLVKSTYLRIR